METKGHHSACHPTLCQFGAAPRSPLHTLARIGTAIKELA
jgi:hypothetical protein